jgi:(R,R)-butanediol dehydrogenase/meso-butanediol dehydrogenase/diacetyl reductase
VVALHVSPVTIQLNDPLLSEKSIVTAIGYRNDFPTVLEHMARGLVPTENGWKRSDSTIW